MGKVRRAKKTIKWEKKGEWKRNFTGKGKEKEFSWEAERGGFLAASSFHYWQK